MAKRIIFILILALVIIQFFQPTKNTGEVYVSTHINTIINVPPEVDTLLKHTCYDCHSNSTEYPWYSSIQPVAWWLADHVDEGKLELNFSAFSTYTLKRQKHKLEEIAELLKKHEMPLNSYTWLHPKARLSADDIELISQWALHSMAALDTVPQNDR